MLFIKKENIQMQTCALERKQSPFVLAATGYVRLHGQSHGVEEKIIGPNKGRLRRMKDEGCGIRDEG